MDLETPGEVAALESETPRPTVPPVAAAPEHWASPADDPALHPPIEDAVLDIRGLNLWYGEKQALFDVSMKIPRRKPRSYERRACRCT